jgi:hypothetical protein
MDHADRSTPQTNLCSLPPVIRGICIEAKLAKTKYVNWEFIGVGNRKTVDFELNKTQFSLKTVNTGTGGTSWIDNMKSHIREIVNYKNLPENNVLKDVELRIYTQTGGSQDVITKLKEYAAERSVTLIVKEYP